MRQDSHIIEDMTVNNKRRIEELEEQVKEIMGYMKPYIGLIKKHDKFKRKN